MPQTRIARSGFYGSLFGWKFKDSEIPGIGYYVIDSANPGGAINPMQPDPGPVVYFDTDDIDQSIGKVRDLGGKSDDKQAIPSQGWFAACVDTEGNKFSLFQNDPSVTTETEQQTAPRLTLSTGTRWLAILPP